MRKRKSWDRYYLDIAKQVASRSPCLSQKLGAILVKDKIVICEGFNGPARNIPACGPDRLKHDEVLRHRLENNAHEPIFGNETTCPRQRLGYPSGQGLDICPAVHAEANCIANAARIGICTAGTIMYLTCGVPCKDCFSLLVNAGVREVVVTSMKRYDDLSEYIMRISKGILDVRIYEMEV